MMIPLLTHPGLLLEKYSVLLTFLPKLHHDTIETRVVSLIHSDGVPTFTNALGNWSDDLRRGAVPSNY